MANNNALEHLLKIEAEAAALVNDAQEEAQKRIHENEEKNRSSYEERYKSEIEKRKIMLEDDKLKTKEIYQKELDSYKDDISRVTVNQQRFSNLMNKLIEEG